MSGRSARRRRLPLGFLTCRPSFTLVSSIPPLASPACPLLDDKHVNVKSGCVCYGVRSERASATLNRGVRLQEGANINKSLLALANCINALADAKMRKNVKVNIWDVWQLLGMRWCFILEYSYM
jgi:hypothetical protein